MKRRTVIAGLGALGLAPVVAACGTGSSTGSTASGSSGASGTAASSGTASLVFDTSAYTEKSKTVSTSSGDVEVTYRFWDAMPYVAAPVDTTYQSLTVSVPVKIAGTVVDASKAPILLALNIGGYMSSAAGSSNPGGGMAAGGAPPAGASGSTGMPSGAGGMQAGGQSVSNGDLALAAGYVVVEPGARGRDLKSSAGAYYGKAPAAIVDLKAAVRFVRANQGRIPGDTTKIVSSGSSAGGALSALLGASGDSGLYSSYLDELGAADASDAIFASGDWCPITDLEHADMAYEWLYGSLTSSQSGSVDATVSKELAAAYPAYLTSLALKGSGGATISAGTMWTYLHDTFLAPSAATYLTGLSAADRTAYLAKNTWIQWSGGKASFSQEDFVAHTGRKKSAPAFDALDLSAAENNEFGDEKTDSRHFTLYSLRTASGDSGATLDADLPEKVDLMNPMYFLGKKNPGRAKHWWIRVGTSDSDTSLTVVAALTARLENLGDGVNTAMYWDAGHGANDDPEAFVAWIGTVTGYSA